MNIYQFHMMALIRRAHWTLLSTVMAVNFCAAVVAEESEISFNRDVRPILSDYCYACHGPDANSREADLRLDQFESATELRNDYRVIDPGHAQSSELMTRIETDDEFLKMPPPEHNKTLTAEQIEMLRAWINKGASYETHWSFTPVRSVTPPVEQTGKQHPIDAFITARLQAEDLTFSPRADPRVLARRLSFDLTGLPADPSQVHQFEMSPTETAYQQMVEELLASPHYGERMAMYWFDLVRYADTLGFHGDQTRSVSPYRDYVIEAFNQNLSFDQFTREQLAGDLLPDPTLQQKVASTYNRLNRASGEGGVQPKEYLAKYVADRVRTLGSVWLGTTVGCAECHDHKFDPYTMKDFYSLGAFFADIREQGIVSGARHIALLQVPSEAELAEKQRLQQAIAQAELTYQQETPEFLQAFAQWQKQVLGNKASWQVLTPKSAISPAGATLTIQDDGSILASGNNPAKETYQITIQLDPATLSIISALQLEVLPDPSLPQQGPGRAANGNLVLQAVNASLNGQPVKWSKATANHSQQNHSPDFLLNGNANGWAILPEIGKRHLVTLLAEKPVDLTTFPQDQPLELMVDIVQNFGSSHTLGKFRFSASEEAALSDPLLFPEESIVALLQSANVQSPQTQAKLKQYFREQTPMLQTVRAELAKLRQDFDRLEKSIVTTLATEATTPREMRVLPRGNWMDDSGEVVLPQIPEFLEYVSDERSSEKERLDRLDLANFLVARENPLVARTFVNRLWMLFFGQGLSRSVDDLGAQGEAPSHPELLDWLAQEFVDSGWNVKHMVELIVTSEAYQQSSFATAALQEQDPFNRLYARQGRWRLEAEMIRDNALAISGLLVNQIGGQSVKPYQPVGYWAQLNFPKRTYQHSAGDNQYRRGLYTHWQRTFLHPSMLAFDAPAREECTARRDRSNTPLQALVLLNDPTYVEAARVFAQHIVQQGERSFADRLHLAFEQALARQPTGQEIELLSQQYQKSLVYYQQNPEAAQQYLKVGLHPVPDELNLAEVAAWMSVTRAILNLHETITRY